MNEELKDMPRLARWLRNLYAASAASLKLDGKPLSQEEQLILLMPDHPLHDALIAKLFSGLADEIREDFRLLRDLSPRGRERMVEAVINRIREGGPLGPDYN